MNIIKRTLLKRVSFKESPLSKNSNSFDETNPVRLFVPSIPFFQIPLEGGGKILSQKKFEPHKRQFTCRAPFINSLVCLCGFS